MSSKGILEIYSIGWNIISHLVVSKVESLPLEWLSKFEDGPFDGEESYCEELVLSHIHPKISKEFIWPILTPRRLILALRDWYCITLFLIIHQ